MSRTLRLTTGLILFAFITMHLLNLSMGLISLEALESSRPYFMGLWSNPVVGPLLLAAMLIHLALGLMALYKKNTLRMKAYDAVQFASALLIMPLLIPHILGLTYGAELFGAPPSYERLLMLFWVQAPMEGLRQVLLVAAVWIHGCVGLFTWMRLKVWWPSVSPLAYPLAVAIPVLALLGFVEAGNTVIASAMEGTSTLAQPSPPDDGMSMEERFIHYNSVKWTILWSYMGLVAAVLIARFVRLRSHASQSIELSYRHGPKVSARPGQTLLEIAQLNDLPHANICRGRGRCGTCRVKIISSTSDLGSPSEMEQKTLARFDSPEGTRLACQITPGPGEIELERLLAPDVSIDDFKQGRDTSFLRDGEAEASA